MTDLVQSENKLPPKWLYRLESLNPENGLWYNSKGEYCWGISEIPNCETKNLPMGYDERYQKDGRDWFSACSNKEDLTHWFSFENALELERRNFVFAKYLATEYVEYPFETPFIKDTALERRIISVEEAMR